MKFTWEPSDISCGRIICKSTYGDCDKATSFIRDFKPCGWTAKWTYKIGWLAGGNPQKEYLPIQGKTRKEMEKYVEENRADYCVIAMTDGMITNPRTQKEMAHWLTKEKMIPMPHEWFLKTVEYLRHLNEHGNG